MYATRDNIHFHGIQIAVAVALGSNLKYVLACFGRCYGVVKPLIFEIALLVIPAVGDIFIYLSGVQSGIGAYKYSGVVAGVGSEHFISGTFGLLYLYG